MIRVINFQNWIIDVLRIHFNFSEILGKILIVISEFMFYQLHKMKDFKPWRVFQQLLKFGNQVEHILRTTVIQLTPKDSETYGKDKIIPVIEELKIS